MSAIGQHAATESAYEWARNSGVALFIFLICVSTFASADDLDQKQAKKERCATAVFSAETAASAEDWISAEKFSKAAIQLCSEVDEHPYQLADHYAGLAEAQIGLERYQDALNTSEQCIDTFYATPNCHYDKMQALLGLKRMAEAKEAGRITAAVCNALLKGNAEDQPRKDQDSLNVLKQRQREAQLVLRRLAEPK